MSNQEFEDLETHYTFSNFVRDKAFFLTLVFLYLVILTTSLAVLAVSPSGILSIDLFTLVGIILYLLYAYRRDAKFWDSLLQLSADSDAVSYFADLVADPTSLDGKLAYAGMHAIAMASQDQILALKQSVEDHTEYFELWVHEIKTPLAAGKLISKRLEGPDKHLMQRELERIEDQIQQALYAARVRSLHHDYLIREVNLSAIAKEACKSNMHYLTSLDMSLEFDIDPQITVFTDKSWLEFVITQIVINSAKYGAKTVQFMAMDASEETAQSNTMLQIKDDGCGIPAADVPRVFDRGFTGEVGRRHGSATGMGLYLASEMCARMGLGIMLASEEGVGTRVMISFPHDRRRKELSRGTKCDSGDSHSVTKCD